MLNETALIESYTREELIKHVSDQYAHVASVPKDAHRESLERLPDETLRSILRVLVRMGSQARFVAMHFMRRSEHGIDLPRYVEVTEEEFFTVREELLSEHNNLPTIMGTMLSIAGVLAWEAKGNHLSRKQRHQALLILASSESLENFGFSEHSIGEYGNAAWINESVFNDYLIDGHSNENFQSVLAEVHSGHGYSRFLEVLESVNGSLAVKPLVTGTL